MVMDKAIELIPTTGKNVVFCDGSAFPLGDGHHRPLIRFAAWSAFDCSFIVCEQEVDLPKQQMITMAETLALDAAIKLNPILIYSDAKNLVEHIGFEYKGVPVNWCRREYNKVADALTKYPAGKGYVVFNSPQVGRDWIDFIYEETEND